MWLKRREFSDWDLKLCHKEIPSFFRRISNVESIRELLKKELNLDFNFKNPDNCGLECFASIPTIRYQYKNSDNSVLINLDCCLLGPKQFYTVGTLSRKILKSDLELGNFSLGEQICYPVRSKIVAYLYKQYPNDYQNLQATHVIPKIEYFEGNFANKAGLFRFDKDEDFESMAKIAEKINIQLEGSYGALQLSGWISDVDDDDNNNNNKDDDNNDNGDDLNNKKMKL